MLVLRNALRGGRRAGFSTAAGTVTGLMSWAVAAALGISALLAASRVGYDTLRFAGGAYLVGLGIVTLRRPGSLSRSAPEEGALERGAPDHNRPRLQRRLEQLTGVVLIAFGVRLAT
ncbi:MAG TPA: LysE family transporter, partial [Acidimicrobiales bacterium]|nr:LysE family transporter [Acidimicrobiales bacterium]